MASRVTSAEIALVWMSLPASLFSPHEIKLMTGTTIARGQYLTGRASRGLVCVAPFGASNWLAAAHRLAPTTWKSMGLFQGGFSRGEAQHLSGLRGLCTETQGWLGAHLPCRSNPGLCGRIPSGFGKGKDEARFRRSWVGWECEPSHELRTRPFISSKRINVRSWKGRKLGPRSLVLWASSSGAHALSQLYRLLEQR